MYASKPVWYAIAVCHYMCDVTTTALPRFSVLLRVFETALILTFPLPRYHRPARKQGYGSGDVTRGEYVHELPHLVYETCSLIVYGGEMNLNLLEVAYGR